MHGRIALAALLLLSACRLSDEQQIGVLKFVASSITGAIDDAQPAAQQVKAVKPARRPCTQNTMVMMSRPMPHRLLHVHSRMRYAASRVERVIASVRHMVVFKSVTVARTCPKRPAASTRS